MNQIKKEVECDYIFKVILLGDTSVGKTSIVTRLREKGFSLKAEPTIGLDFSSLHCNITGGKKVKFHLWDTAGQENFNSIIRTYYRGVACAVIVIDASNKDGLLNAEKWLKSFNNLKSPNSIGKSILLVNKTDLERKISYEDAEGWALDNECLHWEMSAKNNENIAGFLSYMGNNIYNDWDGVSNAAGVSENQIKKRIETASVRGNNLMKACCRIV